MGGTVGSIGGVVSACAAGIGINRQFPGALDVVTGSRELDEASYALDGRPEESTSCKEAPLSNPTPDSRPTKTASMPFLLSGVFGFAVLTVFSIAGAMSGQNGSRPAFIVAAVGGAAMVLTGLVAIAKVRRER